MGKHDEGPDPIALLLKGASILGGAGLLVLVTGSLGAKQYFPNLYTAVQDFRVGAAFIAALLFTVGIMTLFGDYIDDLGSDSQESSIIFLIVGIVVFILLWLIGSTF